MTAMSRSVSVCVTALLVATAGAGPASAASGSNSDAAELCRDSGWQSVTTSDGAAFVSPGDCVSHGARGGTYAGTSPYAETRAFCEEAGGTFSPVDDGSAALWRCETTTVFPESQLGEFSERCTADGGDNTVADFRPDGSEDPYLVTCRGAA